MNNELIQEFKKWDKLSDEAYFKFENSIKDLFRLSFLFLSYFLLSLTTTNFTHFYSPPSVLPRVP